ncbi:FliC/FljB family flagellin [Morganella morganii]|uniref:Flagellin n=1 Tax=bacterium 19GA11TI05 TaxID=2920688 RepID=A0AAU6U0R2_UNCXX
MAQVINTNILSLTTQNNLNRSQGVLGSAIERLSSGSRINSAKDDAAGQAIANRFTANVKGLTQAARNANDGISIAQTAEGAVNEINDNLQRIRELTVQAKNGSNSSSDIKSINEEVNERLAEIDRISKQTQFNGINILQKDTNVSFQVGANDSETIGLAMEKIDSKVLGVDKLEISAMQSRQEGSAVGVNTFKFNDGGKGSTDEDATEFKFNGVEFTTAPADLKQAKDADGKILKDTYLATGKVDDGKGGTRDATFEVKFDRTSKEGTDVFANMSVGQEVYITDGTKANPADSTLKTIDDALTKVDTYRSKLGAFQNRMQSTINNLNNSVNNLSAARSRIQDADFATEVSNMSRGQILQQAGTAVLAQANQVPNGVLSLLR